jgi:group II intron reverse transcriptase/maturase
MKVYKLKPNTHLREPKWTGHKINLEPTKLGMEPNPSGLGHGVIVVGKPGRLMHTQASEGSQSKGKSLRTRVSDIKISTLVRRLFKKHNIGHEDLHNGLIKVISDEELLTLCYEAVRKSKGSMTRGTSVETLDGLTKVWIANASKKIKAGTFNFKPSRRVNIPKPGKASTRPLGVGNPREKIVQKALQVALEYIYEPKFKHSSHGFRPHRGCHSALRQLRYLGAHHAWVIEGDIEKCFDSIPHTVIMKLINRQIRCMKTQTLLWKSLRAGYQDIKGQVSRPSIGTPQGSVVSPTLSNIVLHELDRYMEFMKARVDIGKVRKVNSAFRHIYRSKTLPNGVRRNLLRTTPSRDPVDPNYRRLSYVRYADDFIVLVSASRQYCCMLKTRLEKFLKRLGLSLSPTKTKITSLKKGVHFLGADLISVRSSAKIMKHVTYKGGSSGKRRVNQRLRVLAPITKLLQRLKLAGFIKQLPGEGKMMPTARRAMVPMCHSDILAFYNQKIRGLLNYYSFAGNKGQMHRVLFFLTMSCALTLALKYKLRTARATFRKFGRNLSDPKTDLILDRPKSLKSDHDYKVSEVLETPDQVIKRSWQNKLSQSGLNKRCALCGSSPVEMHHIRGVKLVKEKIKNLDSSYAEFVGAFRRKQIPLCSLHHRDLHLGHLSFEQLKKLSTYG